MTLLPISYFPPVPYMQLLLRDDPATLELHETFPKQTIRNRCVIATSSGMQVLTVPLQERKNHQKTEEIRVDHSVPWQTQHIRALQTAYRRSPYFMHYAEPIFDSLLRKNESLYELNGALLDCLLNLIQVKKEIRFTETFEKDSGAANDFRNAFQSKNPSGYKVTSLPAVAYRQVFQEKTGFLPGLSVLDLLFCEGPRTASLLLKKNPA